MHVTEAVLIGDELDVARGAVGVELADLGSVERARVLPDDVVPRVRKRVLHVQLQLVDLPACELVDETAQGGRRRYLVAADVQHDAARGEIRPVFERDSGELEPPG
jgi:hypothetical protein